MMNTSMEHSPNENKSTKDTVLAHIREHKVSMRPKLYFVFEALLAGFVAVVILVISIALVNFILFGLRINGHEALLGFGSRGIASFFILFPWPLLILDVLLVLFLERLVRRFKFGYRSPILYLLVGLLALAVLGGALFDRATPFNDDLLQRADHGGLPPPLGDLYEHTRTPAPHDLGIYRGIVVDIGTSTLQVRHDDRDADIDDTIYTVMLPPGFTVGAFTTGERLYIAGDMKDGIVHAFGIRTLPQE